MSKRKRYRKVVNSSWTIDNTDANWEEARKKWMSITRAADVTMMISVQRKRSAGATVKDVIHDATVLVG